MRGGRDRAVSIEGSVRPGPHCATRLADADAWPRRKRGVPWGLPCSKSSHSLPLGQETINVGGQTPGGVPLKLDEFHSRSVHHVFLAILAFEEMARIGANRPRRHLDLMPLDRDGNAVQAADPDGNGVFDEGARDAQVNEPGFTELEQDCARFRHAHPSCPIPQGAGNRRRQGIPPPRLILPVAGRSHSCVWVHLHRHLDDFVRLGRACGGLGPRIHLRQGTFQGLADVPGRSLCQPQDVGCPGGLGDAGLLRRD